MVKEDIQRAYEILNRCLETDRHRKTPERYAVLEAIYSVDGHFTIETLNDILDKKCFRVSRATLYNCVKLFSKLGLVVKHQLLGSVVYEASSLEHGHIQQICRICGKTTYLNCAEIMNTIDKMKPKRFCKDDFMLYLYGVCNRCQHNSMRQHKVKNSIGIKKQ